MSKDEAYIENKQKYEQQLDQKFQDFRRICHIYGFKDALAVKKYYDAWINAAALEQRSIDMGMVGTHFLTNPGTNKCDEAEILCFLLKAETDQLEYYISSEEKTNEYLKKHVQDLFDADKEEEYKVTAGALPYNVRKKWGKANIVFEANKLYELKNAVIIPANEFLNFNLVARTGQNDKYSTKFMELNKWIIFPRHEQVPNSAKFALNSLCPFYKTVENPIKTKLEKNLLLFGKEYSNVEVLEPDFNGLMEYISTIHNNEGIRVKVAQTVDKDMTIDWGKLVKKLAGEWAQRRDDLYNLLFKKEYSPKNGNNPKVQPKADRDSEEDYSENLLMAAKQSYGRNPLFGNVFKKIYKNEIFSVDEAIEKLDDLAPVAMSFSVEELIGLKGEEKGLSKVFAQNLSNEYAKNSEYKEKQEAKQMVIRETLRYMQSSEEEDLLAALPNVYKELNKVFAKLKNMKGSLPDTTEEKLKKLDKIINMQFEEKTIDDIKKSLEFKVLEDWEVFETVCRYAPRIYELYCVVKNNHNNVLSNNVEGQISSSKSDHYEELDNFGHDGDNKSALIEVGEILRMMRSGFLQQYEGENLKDIRFYFNYCIAAECLKIASATEILKLIGSYDENMKKILDKNLLNAIEALYNSSKDKKLPTFAELEKAHKKLYKVIYFQNGRELCKNL